MGKPTNSEIQVQSYRQNLLEELLKKCTDEQQDFFQRLYPNGLKDHQFSRAFAQVEATIRNNTRKRLDGQEGER